MYYGDMLTELMATEKNPVNKMYLNEIRIKWKNVEKAATDKAQSNELMVKALNNFTKQLQNKKYVFVKSSEKGFKEDSPLFTPLYLDDLISVFLNNFSSAPMSFARDLPMSFCELLGSLNSDTISLGIVLITNF